MNNTKKKNKLRNKIRRIKDPLKVSDITWPDDWSLEEVGITQSMWSTWLHCKQEFLLHINRWRKKRGDAKFNFGNNVHEVLDKAYTSNKLPKGRTINRWLDDYTKNKKLSMNQKEIETDLAKAEAVLTEYFKYTKNDFKINKFKRVEEEFNVLFEFTDKETGKKYAAILKGKIDAGYISNSADWNMEHKSKSRIDEKNLPLALDMDFQNLYYLLAVELKTGKLPLGTLYNVIRNPGTKQKINESLLEYKQRLIVEIQKKPEHYFKRWETRYVERQHTEFRRDLQSLIKEVKGYVGKTVPKSYGKCLYPFPCQYLEACSSNSLVGYEKADKLFSELEGTQTENDKKEKEEEKSKYQKIFSHLSLKKQSKTKTRIRATRKNV